jgi:hypothetical protein
LSTGWPDELVKKFSRNCPKQTINQSIGKILSNLVTLMVLIRSIFCRLGYAWASCICKDTHMLGILIWVTSLSKISAKILKSLLPWLEDFVNAIFIILKCKSRTYAVIPGVVEPFLSRQNITTFGNLHFNLPSSASFLNQVLLFLKKWVGDIRFFAIIAKLLKIVTTTFFFAIIAKLLKIVTTTWTASGSSYLCRRSRSGSSRTKCPTCRWSCPTSPCRWTRFELG